VILFDLEEKDLFKPKLLGIQFEQTTLHKRREDVVIGLKNVSMVAASRWIDSDDN